MLRFKWHYHSIGENMLVLALEVHFFMSHLAVKGC